MKLFQILIAAGIALTLLGNLPAVAQACDEQSQIVNIEKMIRATENVGFEKLSDEDVKKVNDTFGPPPVDYDSLVLLTNDKMGSAMILVVKDGCKVLNSPRVPLDYVKAMLGRKQAETGDAGTRG
jgi:hypothetical protein